MSKFVPTYKLNPCLACGDISGKCREMPDATQETYLCATYSISSKFDKIPGADGRVWIVTKEATTNMWVVTHPDRSQEISEASKAEYAEKLNIYRQELERRQAEALANEMPPEERHRHYTKILSDLRLTKSDRELLRARGFTDEQIDATGFRSVCKFQKLGGRYPDNLPGYEDRFGGGQLQVYGDGILCPIVNKDNLIIGAQIRYTNAQSDTGEGKNKRYRWLSKKGSANLQGELPVACWDVQQPAEGVRIWLAEGTGIKPRLASFRLNAPVIGAAGGLFSSSPVNTREALEYFSQKYGTDYLTLAIDAGDVVNPQVMHRLRNQIEWLQSEGYKIEIAWWGQVTKEADDIDELLEDKIGEITYLTPDKFLTLAETYLPRDGVGQAAGQVKRPVSMPILKPRSERREEVKAEEIREKTGFFSEDSNPEHQAAWLKLRLFTPDITQDNEFVRFDAPAPGTILGVKSGLGSGKTKQLEELFGPGGAFEHKGAIALFARNSLIFNFVNRVKRFAHLNEELLVLMRDPDSCLALCTNSLKKFVNPEWFDGKILIIDEAVSVALHIACSATHRKDRILSLELFKEAFTRAESVIALDGMLTDWVMDWLGKQAPNKKIVKLENTRKRRKAKVEILLGTPTKTGKFDSLNISPYMAPILTASKPVIVFSDSQKLLEQVELLLIDAGKNGLRIDSKTVYPGSEARKCLDDCNKWIELHLPDYLLCSPTSESGVDISVRGYFTDSYGLFRGVIGTDAQMQMMGRYRDPDCYWHISVPKQSFLGSNRDYDLTNINAAALKLIELADMDISELRLKKDWLGEQFLQYIEEASRDYNNAFALKMEAKADFERKNLRDCLIFALEDSNHEVEQVAYFADEKMQAELKVAGAEVKKRTAVEIFEAADITDQQAEELAASWSATWEDRVKLIKASYKRQLPGIEFTEHWTPEFIEYLKYDNPKMISGANLLYQFLDVKAAERKQTNVWARVATERGIFLPDLYSPLLKVRALESLNLERFLDESKVWHKDSPEILELIKKGRDAQICNALGFKVPLLAQGPNKGKPDGIRYLRRLLELVGLRLGPCHKKRENGAILNIYSLDDTWLKDPVWLAVQEAVERRFTEFNAEWVYPEVLKVKTFENYTDALLELPDLSQEPETDSYGIDWRQVELEVTRPVGKLAAGDVVIPLTQPRFTAEETERKLGRVKRPLFLSQTSNDEEKEPNWLIWVKNAVGTFLIEFNRLSLYFEPTT